MTVLREFLHKGDTEKSPVAYNFGTADIKSLNMNGEPVDKKRCGRWSAASFIFASTVLERTAWLMLASNLVHQLHGLMRESNKIANRNVHNWIGTSYIASLFGGYVADAHFGRFWAICVFSCTYVVGFLVLTMSVSLPSLSQISACEGSTCPEPNPMQMTVFYLALYMLALGTGGVWPSVPSFGADQFDERDPGQKMSRNSFFNWLLFSDALGSLIAYTALVYVQNHADVQWNLGISSINVSISLAVFLLGMSVYRYRQLKGNPFTSLAQVVVAAVRKKNLVLPQDESKLYEEREIAAQNVGWTNTGGLLPRLPSGRQKLCHTRGFRWLDRAAVIDTSRMADGTARLPVGRWCLCPVTQVEELKIILRLLPIWVNTLMFSIVNAQVPTLFVQQGDGMDNGIGLHGRILIPSVSMQAVTALVILVAIPCYDLILVPLVRRFTKNERGFSLLQRMGIGLLFSILAMVAAALVEIQRRQHHNLPILWLIPQYCLVGLGEVFTSVGLLEFLYDQAPNTMKTFCTALYFANYGVAQFLSSLLSTVVNDVTERNNGKRWVDVHDFNRGRLDLYYFLLAGLAGANLIVYVISASHYKYKKVDTSCRVIDSRSFEWNVTELGLMQKPSLFKPKSSLKVVKEEEEVDDYSRSPATEGRAKSESSPSSESPPSYHQ